jgi:hypothetical protein
MSCACAPSLSPNVKKMAAEVKTAPPTLADAEAQEADVRRRGADEHEDGDGQDEVDDDSGPDRAVALVAPRGSRGAPWREVGTDG